MNLSMEQKKWMLPVLLAGATLVFTTVAKIIFNLIGAYPLPDLFPIVMLCILTAVLPITQKSGNDWGKPLFYVSLVLLGLQLLGNLLAFLSAIFYFNMPMSGFFDLIPGIHFLSSLIMTVKIYFDFGEFYLGSLLISVSFFISAISSFLCLASNLCLLLVCSEFTDFYQLDTVREKMYSLLKINDDSACTDNGSHWETQSAFTRTTEEKEDTTMDRSITPQRSTKDAPSELFARQSIPTAVILSLVTCGIYGIIWTYSIMKKIRLLNEDSSSVTGELLCFIFVPFYGLYWYYSRAERLSEGASAYGLQIPNNGILYLILAVFGLPIIGTCLMQNDLNTVADVLNGTASAPNFGTQVSQEFQNAVTNVNSSVKKSAASTNSRRNTNNNSSVAFEQLEKLAELHKQGILTDEEFSAKKADLLNRI